MSERMWAPWRMEYIEAPKPVGCPFCEIGNVNVDATPDRLRTLLALVVAPNVQIVLNAYPFAAGHLLVMPRKHVSDFADLSRDEYAAVAEGIRETVARVRSVLSPDGVNVGFNLGKAAGAGIAEHLHAHIVPRFHGDTNFLPVMADTRVMPEMLDRTWEKLAPAFADLPGAVR